MLLPSILGVGIQSRFSAVRCSSAAGGKISLMISIEFTGGRCLKLKISCQICHWTHDPLPSLLAGLRREGKHYMGHSDTHRMFFLLCFKNRSSRLGFTLLSEDSEQREYISVDG